MKVTKHDIRTSLVLDDSSFDSLVKEMKEMPPTRRMTVLLECVDDIEFDLQEHSRFILSFRDELKAIREANQLSRETNMNNAELVREASCWIEEAEGFKIPEKIYDVNKGFRENVAKSFAHYPKNLGVLLSGNKGQGKSLNAKMLCLEMGLPVIMINKSIKKEIDFVGFLQNIRQDHIVFIDEFEKLFAQKGQSTENADYHEQDVFLSYMDGVLTNEHKTLFLLTTNNQVNEYFLNRPSRVKFLQEYDELPEDIFHMITDDKLENKEFKEDLEENISLVNMNIDLLISIIDDINLFNKPFSEFKESYNYKLEKYRYEMTPIAGKESSITHIFSTASKIKPKTNYINGKHVTEILKFTKDEIVFTTKEWVDFKNRKGEEDEKQVDVTYRVTPSKGLTYSEAY